MKDMSTVALGNLVSVSEAVQILAERDIHRSAATVKYYCQRGYLLAKVLGRAWMIDRDSLATFEPPDRGNPDFGPQFRKNLATCS